MELLMRIKEKVFPTGALLNLMGKERGVSFYIVSNKFSKDVVEVLVRGEVRKGLFDKLVDEEWVVIEVPVLADQFYVEKYGHLPDRRSLEWKREYIRAKLVASRYAVGLAKKRIELRFAGKDFRDFAEKEAEKNELTNIYLTAEELRKKVQQRKKALDHVRKIKRENPELYKEVIEKFGGNLESVEFRTEEQSKKIHALVREMKMEEVEYRKLLKEKFGVSSSMGLTKQEASELIQELESRKEVTR